MVATSSICWRRETRSAAHASVQSATSAAASRTRSAVHCARHSAYAGHMVAKGAMLTVANFATVGECAPDTLIDPVDPDV